MNQQNARSYWRREKHAESLDPGKRKKHCTRIQYECVKMNHRKTSVGFNIPFRVNVAIHKQQFTSEKIISLCTSHNPYIQVLTALCLSHSHNDGPIQVLGTSSLGWHSRFLGATLHISPCVCHPGITLKYYVIMSVLFLQIFLGHSITPLPRGRNAWTDIKDVSNVVLTVSPASLLPLITCNFAFRQHRILLVILQTY